MAAAIKYLVDEKGRKTSVVVPVQVWEQLNTDHQQLQRKLEVFQSIQEGLAEVDRAKKTGKKLSSIKDLLK